MSRINQALFVLVVYVCCVHILPTAAKSGVNMMDIDVNRDLQRDMPIRAHLLQSLTEDDLRGKRERIALPALR